MDKKKYIPNRFITPTTKHLYYKFRDRVFSLVHPVETYTDVINVYHCCTPKTASTWFSKIFADPIIYRRCGLLTYQYQRFLPNGADRRPLDERNFQNCRFPSKAIITQLYIDWHSYQTIHKPTCYRTFFVLRDPRDLIVSWYFSMKDTHALLTEELFSRRRRLRSLDQSQGLAFSIREMARRGHFRAQHSWWINQNKDENVKLYRFEGLFGSEQFNVVSDLMKHLRIPIKNRELKQLLEKHSFAKKQKQSNHYRKGKAGDWRNYLTLDHLGLLSELTDNITKMLGYD